jgi:nitroimidazol reductase NimA-like FMN-containing flavoprotein (pyridoxamine 5'-phosphate oxidase superfamily)
MVPMRRKERELGESAAFAVVEQCKWAVLSTINSDERHPLGVGAPCAVPVSPVLVDKMLYIHSATEGHKIGNMKQDNRVCLACVGMAENDEPAFSVAYSSAVVYARAFEVNDREEKKKALVAICRKYAPTQMSRVEDYIGRLLDRTAIWRLEPIGTSGKQRQFESR